MLGNLKKKLSNAIQEASDSIQQQYKQRISTPTTPVTPTFEENFNSEIEFGINPDINMAAGCSLLAKYEDDWKVIHDMNELNAQTAHQIAKQIEDVDRRTTKQHGNLKDFMNCISDMPNILEKVQISVDIVKEISALTKKVEEELEQLVNLCEECDLQEFVLHKQFELQDYKQEKMTALEVYRQKVASEHEAKIKEHEERLRQIQRERQAVFDDAFRIDLEEYKQTGSLQKIHTQKSKSMSLEDVVLEDTGSKDALEEFLNG